MRRWMKLVGASALLVVLLGACSSSGQKTGTSGSAGSQGASSSSSSSASSASSDAAGAASLSGTISLTAKEYAYDAGGPPPSVPAGPIKVELTNAGSEEHQATIVKLNSGVTADQFGAAAAGDPTGVAALKLVSMYGGPNAVGAGQKVSTTQVLQPGSYMFMCFIPGADGAPHASKGMVLPFTVTGSDSTASVSGSQTITASEFGWAVPDKLKSGSVQLKNAGTQAHELTVYKLQDGKTLADAKSFLGSRTPSGPPPYDARGGFGPISPGQLSTSSFELEPGKYLFVCFLPDVASDGAPHFTKGMIQEVDVS